MEKWRVEEVSRRKQFTGVGAGFGDEDSGAGFATGFIHDTGKAHHLVVPYIDSNGVPQEPRFGVPSLGGKAIREWSLKLYEKVVDAKRAFPQATS